MSYAANATHSFLNMFGAGSADNPMATASGELASAKSNLQNIVTSGTLSALGLASKETETQNEVAINLNKSAQEAQAVTNENLWNERQEIKLVAAALGFVVLIMLMFELSTPGENI